MITREQSDRIADKLEGFEAISTRNLLWNTRAKEGGENG